MVWARVVRRWRRNMDVSGDPEYAANLATLSEASVRRHFNPYTDIDWERPDFSVRKNDPRWVLSTTDLLGQHPWYRAQPLEKQIEIGLWRQANTAKISLQLESILIRGLVHYTFWVPNGSPEFRYCTHESIEECHHTMMFQELVNRIGMDVPGMPRWLRWISPVIPLYAGPLPGTFFFGVMAGELPIHIMQKSMLRQDNPPHPMMEKVMAIHVAEESRHISFADQFLARRVPNMVRRSRFALSLYVPIVMRVLCQAIVVPPRSFFREFDVPRSVRKELFFDAPDARQVLRDMYGDVRMLCADVGLMNPVAVMLWRICKINGQPSRYRGEPQRAHRPSPASAA
ncbi:AurF N-oxygenase family protein [Candidatus Mycobacterium methanotrophicum]|uniref:Diiron oxygenase n=1 Tax=Candidatus Mycobacterium methanotrophicum TaxID=2943498 RepID=A0ABY4QS54_9MYCO|nr:diiron oxygenase [Candidatus Mycobacterium methanotrophicum]UQX13133.1 diiron oxygenase [Candidatus Mycobacterium methanotrophicum]